MRTVKRKAEQTARTKNQILLDMGKLLPLYRLCMANSERLLQAAKVLEKHAFYPQAFFLALTAGEEIAKGQVVADYAEDCVSRKEFDDAFRQHSFKNAYLQRKVELSTGTTGQATDATISYDLKKGKDLAEWREHALYVSTTDGFVGWSPETQITKEQCREIIFEIEHYTEHLRIMEAATERIGIKSLTK